MPPSEHLAKRIHPLTASGEQVFGKASIGQKLTVNSRGRYRIQSPSRDVLQPHIQVAIDLSARQRRAEIGGSAGIRTYKIKSRMKFSLSERCRDCGVACIVKTFLYLININRSGFQTPEQDKIVTIPIQVIAPDGTLGKHVEERRQLRLNGFFIALVERQPLGRY